MKVSFDRLPRRTRHQFAAWMAVFAVFAAYLVPWIAILFIGAMVFVLIQRQELTLDLDQRTYEINHGLGRRSGPFSHLKGIELDRCVTATRENPSSPSRYVVSLRWVNERESPWELANSPELAEALADARLAAQRLSLPLSEGKNLVSFRNDIESARTELLKM